MRHQFKVGYWCCLVQLKVYFTSNWVIVDFLYMCYLEPNDNVISFLNSEWTIIFLFVDEVPCADNSYCLCYIKITYLISTCKNIMSMILKLLFITNYLLFYVHFFHYIFKTEYLSFKKKKTEYLFIFHV